MTTYASDICVVIPVFNEGMTIRGTVGALRRAGFRLADVYIANDASTDDTLVHARATGANVMNSRKNKGKAGVLRTAFRYFSLTNRYRWVVFLDGDTKVHPGFLEALLRAANSPKNRGEHRADLFVGRVLSTRENTVYSALRSYDYAYGQALAKSGQSNWNVVYVSPGCASMYRSSVLRHLHLSSDTVAEDMDLTLQVHQHGGRVVYVPDAAVITQDPSSLHDYHKQVMRWYRGFWQVVKKFGILRLNPSLPARLVWYMRWSIFDALFLNRFIGMLFVLALYPSVFPLWLLADFIVGGAVALWASVYNKRPDTLYKYPAYYLVTYVNIAVILHSFYEVMIQGRTTLSWNKLSRRSFDNSRVSEL